MTRRSVSVAELRSECVNLERAVLHAGLATEAEIAKWRPGGENNGDKGAGGFLRFYGRLQRYHARGEYAASSDARLQADAAVLAALRDEPIRVDLITEIALGPAVKTKSLLVYPKSLEALAYVHALDREIGWVIIQMRRLEDLGEQGVPGMTEAHRKCAEVIAYLYGLLAWIVTSEGPAMPFDIVKDDEPELPAYVKALNPMDIPQIAAAVQRHHARLAAVQVLIDHKGTSDGGKRPTWSQFIGTMAIELDTDSVHLSKRRSLGSLLASVQFSNDAKHVEPDEK